MKKLSLLIVLVLFSVTLFSQDSTVVFSKATFDGNLNRYLGKSLNYPLELAEKGVQGQTNISFVIDKDGYVDSVDILDYLDQRGAQQAAQLIKSTNVRWNPTIENNEPVSHKYQLIIRYVIIADPSSKEKSTKLYDKAVKKSNKGNFPEALKIINHAVLLNPYSSSYYKLRSNIYSSMNDTGNAEKEALRALYIERNILAVVTIVGFFSERRTYY